MNSNNPKSPSHITPNNHHHLRRRTSINFKDSVDLTDQSYKNSSDINVIMARYYQTGVMPSNSHSGEYLDNTLVPSLEEAHALVQDAKTRFSELPFSIRAQMSHNPQNLETFLADPDNRDQLLKHGLINPQVEPSPKEMADPPAVAPPEVTKS